jgi:hypothetical protein
MVNTLTRTRQFGGGLGWIAPRRLGSSPSPSCAARSRIRGPRPQPSSTRSLAGIDRPIAEEIAVEIEEFIPDQRGADIARFAGLDDVVQRFERLLDWRIMVETVDLIKVDIIHAEPTPAVVV